MKKILIDARMVGPVGHGISNYVTDIARSLEEKADDYELHFLVTQSLPKDHFLRRFPLVKTDISFLHPRETLSLPSVVRKFKPDFYHTPSFSSLLHYPCPFAQTVHDLNHLRFGSLLQKIYYRTLLAPSLKKARFILSVSESARSELENWLGQKKEILVARNIIEPFQSKSEGKLSDYGLESKKYFFCLSNHKPHKNLEMLTRAYISARKMKSLPPLAISISGESSNGIRKLGPLPSSDISLLLREARAFFFPSLYEGFGRPPLESALAGVLPIVSNIPPHKEGLAGVSEALFLDPSKERDWEKEFLRWSDKIPEPISEKSKEWIREEYSLKRLGTVMHNVYQAGVSSY